MGQHHMVFAMFIAINEHVLQSCSGRLLLLRSAVVIDVCGGFYG